MIRFSARIFLEVLAALIASALLLGGSLVWRLSQPEPIHLNFLTPYLEQAMELPDRGISVDIDETAITWAGWDRTFDLRAQGVHVMGSGGEELARLPELSLTLSMRALLRGIIAPTQIEVIGADLALVREGDGRLHFGHSMAPDAELTPEALDAAESTVIPAILAELIAPADRTKPSGYLARLTIRDAQLRLIDRRLGQDWTAHARTILLERLPDGIVGELSLTVPQLGADAALSIDLVYERDDDRLLLEGRFGEVELRKLQVVLPALAMLGDSDLRLAGRLGTELSLQGRLGDVAFDLEAGPGEIFLPDHFELPLIIGKVAFSGRLRQGFDHLTIARADVELDGPRLTATLDLSGLRNWRKPRSGGLDIAIDGQIENVAVDQLYRYWPLQAAANARDWVVAHMDAGHVSAATFGAKLRLLPGGGEPLLRAFGGKIEADGVRVHYLAPLPPVSDAAGTATFSASEFNAEFRAGRVDNIAIEGGHLRISGLDQTAQWIEVNGKARASLADALALLDHPRLGYVTAVGIDPTGAEGQTATDLSFAFPAIKNLTFEQVDIGASGDIVGANLRRAMFDQPLRNGNFALTLDDAGMILDGTASLGVIDAAITWRQSFDPAATESRRMTLNGRIDAEARATMGLDTRPHLDGPVDARVVATEFADGRSVMAIDLDLAPATIDLPAINFRKDPGIAGGASMILGLSADGKLDELRSFVVDAGGLSAAGAGRFDPLRNALAAVSLERVTWGLTDLRAVEVELPEGRYDIQVGAGVFDAEPFLIEAKEAPPVDPAVVPDPSGPEERTPFSFVATNLTQVRLDAERALDQVSVEVEHDGRYWDRIVFNGRMEGQSTLSFRYGPGAPGQHALEITTDNAGAALRTLDIFNEVRGGTLTVTGIAEDTDPWRRLNGRAEIVDFRLVNQPAITRLLSIATLTGLIDLLTGEGFLFQRFTADFTKLRNRVESELARAYGPSIGITAQGWFDLDTDQIEARGTIVPAYGLNSILGNIPLIGDLLQGGEGEGLFAATYSATGRVSEPEFSVNPLAALAPGFLRGLFEIGDGGERSEPTALPDPTNK